jgi:DNA-binding NarL/FixJ family response regulator
MAIRESLLEGEAALVERRWDDAVSRFRVVVNEDRGPEALDGLGLALWWQGHVAEGLSQRAQACELYRKAGEFERSAVIAAWLSREYSGLYRNSAEAGGWLARGASALEERPESAAWGWLELARSELDAGEGALAAAERALRLGRQHDDVDLEVTALSRLGLLEIENGAVDRGIQHLDEAMAAATAGEVDIRVFGDACCGVMNACEVMGGAERLGRWTETLNSYMDENEYAPLSAYCGSCCGNLMMAAGQLEMAEEELLKAISKLSNTEMESRCIHPVTQLAELRVVQGRIEEAEELLVHFEDLPESAVPLAAINLARGDAQTAAARLRRRMRGLGNRKVLLPPILVLLVDAEIAQGELENAEQAAAELTELAELTKSKRHIAEAAAARAKVQAASKHPGAPERLDEALQKLEEAHLPLESARVRLIVAELISDDRKDEAVVEARAALAAFERLGAGPDADRAAALLRRLGVGGRTGAKDVGTLTTREQEVLRLVAQGLSNAEIGERLFISTKTAGHHVSNILSKLNLRSRTEAAAFAVLHLDPEPAPK